MTKRPQSTATPATDLSAPERVLLFCVASDIEWERAGIFVVIDRDYPDQIDVEVVHSATLAACTSRSSPASWASVSWTPRCSSIHGIGMRADRLPVMRAASSVLMRFASLASRSSMLRQNASRASTVGVSSIEPSPAMCSWQTLPAIRRVSTEAHLQAVACLTEANKHDVVARRKTTRRCHE
jgi:hypothetical protein